MESAKVMVVERPILGHRRLGTLAAAAASTPVVSPGVLECLPVKEASVRSKSGGQFAVRPQVGRSWAEAVMPEPFVPLLPKPYCVPVAPTR
jgi:hypothetical protein